MAEIVKLTTLEDDINLGGHCRRHRRLRGRVDGRCLGENPVRSVLRVASVLVCQPGTTALETTPLSRRCRSGCRDSRILLSDPFAFSNRFRGTLGSPT